MNNLLTDIAGVRVGHADDAKLASGVTAVVFDQPAVAGSPSPGKTFARFGAAEWDERRTAFRDVTKTAAE